MFVQEHHRPRCASGASTGTLNGHTPIHQTIRARIRKVVTRIDSIDQSGKPGNELLQPWRYRNYSGTPLLVLGDSGACPIVIVEGEAKADDLFEAFYTDEGLCLPFHAVASYPHGAEFGG